MNGLARLTRFSTNCFSKKKKIKLEISIHKTNTGQSSIEKVSTKFFGRKHSASLLEHSEILFLRRQNDVTEPKILTTKRLGTKRSGRQTSVIKKLKIRAKNESHRHNNENVAKEHLFRQQEIL